MRALSPPEDQEWLAALFDLHATAVRAYAVRRVGPDTADDIVAEVFATAWRRRRSVPEPAIAWLLRTARHVIAHERRGLARRLNLQDAIAESRTPTASPSADDASRVLAESIHAQ